MNPTLRNTTQKAVLEALALMLKTELFFLAELLNFPYFDVDDFFEMMFFLYVSPDIRVKRANERAIQRFGSRVLEGGIKFRLYIKN